MENIKWTKLLIMAVLSFIVMYALMYIMVDSWSNVYINLNQFYMVIAMTSAMVLVEIFVMKSMYERTVKISAIIFGLVLLIISIIFVRNQTAISDREFLESMISHHAAALLMCNKAKIQDVEIKSLCESIITNQASQIDWMKTKLSTLK